MVRELVTDPGAYMERKVRGRTIWLEVLVVLVSGLLGSAGLVFLVRLVLSLTEELTGYSNFQAIGFAIEPVLGIFAFWFGAAVVMHFVAGHYNSRGPIRRLLKASAWAMVPIGLGNLVRSVAIVIAYRNVGQDDVTLEPGSFDAHVAVLQDLHMDGPIVLLGTLVLLATVVWSGYLLSFAVEAAKQNLSEADARKTAAVPTAILLLYLLWALAGRLGLF